MCKVNRVKKNLSFALRRSSSTFGYYYLIAGTLIIDQTRNELQFNISFDKK